MPIPNPDAPVAELTIRQHIAIEVMNGVLASGRIGAASDKVMEELAKFSFKFAEHMIAQGQ